MVYSDTGAYIASGFEGTVPGDRPITYGLFLRHSSLAASLWFTVISQALLLSALLYYFIGKVWSEPKARLRAFLGSTVLLILGSGISYFASLLMADIFTPVSFLILFILIFDAPKNKVYFGLLSLVYLFVTSTHLTHAPAHLAMLLALALLKLFPLRFLELLTWRKWAIGLALVMLNFLFLPAVHYYYNGGFVSSKNGHIFFTARMVENGALKALLADECDHENYALCAYKDSLPIYGSDFLWQPSSVLYKLGGWGEHAAEYKHLNKQIFTHVKYLQIYLRHFYGVALFHLSEHNVGEELIPMGLNTPPGWEIDNHFKEELPRFLAAKQANDYWPSKIAAINNWVYFVFILSLLVVLLELVFSKSNLYLKLLICCSLLFYLGNFFVVCIASSASRYNSRLDWLIVFLAIVVVMDRLGNLKRLGN